MQIHFLTSLPVKQVSRLSVFFVSVSQLKKNTTKLIKKTGIILFISNKNNEYSFVNFIWTRSSRNKF